MSRSTTASRALAILLLGAALSTSGVLAAPTSMDPTQMSSHPSSNGARDLQFQSADGQAHSLSDEGLELELPQTVQVHRGGVEHPDVVLRRDGNRLSFADSGFLSKKDGIDPSTISVSVDLEHAQDLRERGHSETSEPEPKNPQQEVAIRLAVQAAELENVKGAKELGDTLWKLYDEINPRLEEPPDSLSITKRPGLVKLYELYMSTVTEMVHAAEKAVSFVPAVLDPISLSDYQSLLSKFDKLEAKIIAQPDPDGQYGAHVYNAIVDQLETIQKDTNRNEYRARRLKLVEKYMDTVRLRVSDARKAAQRDYTDNDSEEGSAKIILKKWESMHRHFKNEVGIKKN
ncbi:hypothetical protein EV361DRAFT_1035630 [Lentinula raphanica]|nr:hypothetical protein EV361DRAFT_1035630 [Lentinula raphanica]